MKTNAPNYGQNTNKQIIYYDGICVLCDSFVMWIIKRDHQQKYVFCSIQSTIGQQKLKQYATQLHFSKDTILLQTENQLFDESTAVIHILTGLGGIYKLATLIKIIPKSLRDFAYRLVAKNRYCMFGKMNTCTIPNPSIKHRFIK